MGQDAPASRSAGRRRSPAIGWALALTLVTLLFYVLCARNRPPLGPLWGDEGTFVAMAASLALDGDLRFDDRDEMRARSQEPPTTVILQRTGRGVFYSKPVLFPFLAAPFYRLLGTNGVVIVNLLALVAALTLGWRHLRRLGPPDRAALTLVTFVGAAALLPYVAWRMSDVLQFSLALGGLVLSLGARAAGGGDDDDGSRPSPAAPVAGGLALGLLAAMRLPNAALAAAASLALFAQGRSSRALRVAVGAAVGFVLLSGLNLGLSGAASPYRAVRSSFNAEIGYPSEDGRGVVGERFDRRPATHRAIGLDLQRSAYAALYFVVGRHSGLAVYFPAAVLLLVTALRRPDRTAVILWLGAAALSVFYLLVLSSNYFGGSTFIGNRYYLVAYPVALVALRSLPGGRSIAACWLVALLAGGSALVSLERTRGMARDSQTHAHAGLFRLLPYESTTQSMDGQVERYWSGQFQRFLDPFARVAEASFEIHQSRPAAQVEIARNTGGEIVLLARASAPAAELRIASGRASRSYRLGSSDGGAHEVVRFDPGSTWRRHHFWWWNDSLYEVHLLRFSVRSLGGEPATVELRYLGDGSALERVPQPEIQRAVVRWTADGTPRLDLRVRNAGSGPWPAEGALPVRLGYRVLTDGGLVHGEGTVALEETVRSGAVLDQSLAIDGPRDPGRYSIEVDLIVEPLYRLESRRGEPLAVLELSIEEPPTAAATEGDA